MRNLDNTKNMDDLRIELFNSLKSDDAEVQEKAFLNFTEGLQNSIITDAKNEVNKFGANYNDEQILINRGTRKALTSQEKKYFNAVIERKGFDKVEETFPETIIEDVFKKLQEEHPILSKIDMKDTTALTKYIFAKPNKAKAFWGPICEDIKQMILDGFEVINLDSSRLSGFVPVCKGMLELGPVWLAQYVTTLMYEIMAASLEIAVISGDGKDKPVGMTRSLKNVLDGVYPEKTKVTLKDFTPKSLGGIRGAMAKAKTDVGEVEILVNPITYWTKVFPNLAYQTVNGVWVLDKLPTGETIIKSHAMPEDTLIFGVLDNYFLGVSGDVRIDRYDQTLAIENMDLFIAKFYGHGVPKDPNAFFVADIASVEGSTKVEIEEIADKTPSLPEEEK